MTKPTVTEAARRLAEALEAVLPYVEDAARGEGVYGYFPGGDPREFMPDPECSTEAERAAHAAACEAWERGERPGYPGPHAPLVVDGKEVGHVTRAYFGMGCYTFRNPEAEESLATVNAALTAYREAKAGEAAPAPDTEAGAVARPEVEAVADALFKATGVLGHVEERLMEALDLALGGDGGWDDYTFDASDASLEVYGVAATGVQDEDALAALGFTLIWLHEGRNRTDCGGGKDYCRCAPRKYRDRVRVTIVESAK